MTWLYFSLAAATFESLRDVLSKVVTNKGNQPLDEYLVAWALRAFTLIIYIPWLLLSPNPVPAIGKDFWWALLADATLSTIGGILYIRALRFGDISLTMLKSNFYKLVLLGSLKALDMWCHVMAIASTVAANSVAVKQSSLLMTVGHGYFLFHEKNIKHRLLGCIIIIFGVCILSIF